MLKKDGLEKQTRLSLAESMRCSECLHFKQFPHPSHKEVCTNLGVRTFAIAPSCFTPDFTKVSSNMDEFVQLAALLVDKTSQQKRIMLAMLRQKSKDNKLPIGAAVYFNVRGREYISNYVWASVVGYTSAGQIVLAGSATGNRGRTFFAYLRNDDTLLTPDEWSKKFVALRKAGKVNDPKGEFVRDITAEDKAEDYEVPTIDSLSPEEKARLKQAKKSKTGYVPVDRKAKEFTF
jgi:hypothetical protein